MRTSLIFVVVLAVSMPCFAAKKKHPAEVYAATTDDGSEVDGTEDGTPRQMAGSAGNSSSVRTSAAPTAAVARASSAPVAPKKVALAYDPVPFSQTDSIARRLRYVEYLIRKHGRAYDYRSHTLREFEQIVAQLDGSPAPAVAPAPQPRGPETLNLAPVSQPAENNLPADASAEDSNL